MDEKRLPGAPRPQLLLLTAGAVIGAVLLAAALVVDLTGANDPRTPTMPTPVRPTMPSLPTTFPTVPPGGTGLPTQLPTDFPTGMPSFPTDLPSIPQIPGGAP
ncbi:hypothetical protein [Actinomadura verrucosospora]|uniref:Cell surface protein n=1 Tax=Actinomadura verrucosospora TaxID=46165 RepID=A0A7D3VXS5_ACTVE|nr:hypothetical protein [Actinomadura verrucosospora]QKG25940.1 cell surface protein precursor [Actinomadura verrucosospora]